MSKDTGTILVIEDNPADILLLRKVFQKLLLKEQVQVVKNGDEAIDYLGGTGLFHDRQLHPYPAFILMDLDMPRKGGFEILEWLRNHQYSAFVPIVVFTASSREEDIERAYSLGANSYVVKPSRNEELLRTIRTIYDYWLLCEKPKPPVYQS